MAKSHIGEQIKQVLEKNGMTKSELARRLNMSTTNVHKIFKRETIDTGLLQKISQELNHNFFSAYQPKIKEAELWEEPDVAYKTNQKNISKNSSEELKLCRTEIELLHKEIAYLKKIITLLENKKKVK